MRLLNWNTALTDCNILQHSKTIQILNEKQARQSLFTSVRPNRYTEENTDNQNKILLPGKTIIKTVDEKNIFDAPTKGTLLPWNLQTSWKRENNLLFYIAAFNLSIHPKPLAMNLLQSLNSEMVMEDHGSTKGVTLGISGISEPCNE